MNEKVRFRAKISRAIRTQDDGSVIFNYPVIWVPPCGANYGDQLYDFTGIPIDEEYAQRQGSVLCYIDRPWAYFTTRDLEAQHGDDWDDRPYACNAGEPYRGEGYEIYKLAFQCNCLETLSDYDINAWYSVCDINEQKAPWLQPNRYNKSTSLRIWAGTTMKGFRRLIGEAGGTVYMEE